CLGGSCAKGWAVMTPKTKLRMSSSSGRFDMIMLRRGWINARIVRGVEGTRGSCELSECDVVSVDRVVLRHPQLHVRLRGVRNLANVSEAHRVIGGCLHRPAF